MTVGASCLLAASASPFHNSQKALVSDDATDLLALLFTDDDGNSMLAPKPEFELAAQDLSEERTRLIEMEPGNAIWVSEPEKLDLKRVRRRLRRHARLA